MATRCGEQNNPTRAFKPPKHLNKTIQHSYYWTTLGNAFKHTRTRKNSEAIYMALLRPNLNNQLKSKKLLILRKRKN